MKIEILKEHLDRGVSLVSRVSNKNLSLPVLGCVVFVISKDRAVLRATNLDISIEYTLKAKVFTEGVVAVPAQVLAQTVSAFSDQKLIIELTDGVLVIRGERGVSTIAPVDASEFPTIPYVKESGETVKLLSSDLIPILKSVAFSASTSSMRPELASIACTFDGAELRAAATDSFRLAEVKLAMKGKARFDTTLIPARNISDLLRFIEQGHEVEVRVAETQLTLLNDAGFITSRIIDGAFPDYRGLIPTEFVATATALREDVIRAFRKVSIFADAFNQVHISISPQKKSFVLKAANTAVGSTDEAIPASISGDSIDINFNAKYITEALAVMSGDSITFSIAGKGKPMLIEDSPQRGFLALVMPMNK